jgi:hypothetical protein
MALSSWHPFWALPCVITITHSSASASDATRIAAGKANASKCEADSDEFYAAEKSSLSLLQRRDSALQSFHPDSSKRGSLSGSSSATWPDRSGSGTSEKGPAFNRDCKAFPNKRIIMVTPNVEYWDMFLNWFHYANEHLGENDQLVVVAQDEGAVTMLRNSSFVFMDTNGTLNRRDGTLNQASVYKNSLLAGPFGSREFNTLTGKRPAHILHFLELGCTVLYADVDAVWLGDVFQDLAEAGSHDLYVTDDSSQNLAMASNGGDIWYFCSCFLYLQPTPAVRELVQTWHQVMSPEDNDQPAFNDALKTVYETRGSLDFVVLPYEAFPPGCYVDTHGVRPTMHVLHANYRIGLEAKIKFMVDHKVSEQLIRS